MISKQYRLKLMKYLQLYKEIVTDKGTLIAEENEITVGSEVFIDENGNIVPAPNGTYENIEYIITVEEGVVKEIIEKEKEEEVETVETKEEIIEKPVEEVFENAEETKEETSETTTEEVKDETSTEEQTEATKEEPSDETIKEIEDLKATIEEQRKEIESLKTLVKEYEEKETVLLDPALGEKEDKIEEVDPRLAKALKAAEILKRR